MPVNDPGPRAAATAERSAADQPARLISASTRVSSGMSSRLRVHSSPAITASPSRSTTAWRLPEVSMTRIGIGRETLLHALGALQAGQSPHVITHGLQMNPDGGPVAEGRPSLSPLDDGDGPGSGFVQAGVVPVQLAEPVEVVVLERHWTRIAMVEHEVRTLHPSAPTETGRDALHQGGLPAPEVALQSDDVTGTQDS